MDGDVREIVSAISMDVMKYTKKWQRAGGGVAEGRGRGGEGQKISPRGRQKSS